MSDGTPKTFKRETAWGMLAFIAALVLWGVWEPRATEAAQMLIAPVFLFAGAAFGVDAYAKQVLK